jgi:hypothetical protein
LCIRHTASFLTCPLGTGQDAPITRQDLHETSRTSQRWHSAAAGPRERPVAFAAGESNGARRTILRSRRTIRKRLGQSPRGEEVLTQLIRRWSGLCSILRRRRAESAFWEAMKLLRQMVGKEWKHLEVPQTCVSPQMSPIENHQEALSAQSGTQLRLIDL